MADAAYRVAESWLPEVATYGYGKLRLSDAGLQGCRIVAAAKKIREIRNIRQ